MSLLLYRILETEVNRDSGKLNSEVRSKILEGYLNEENVSALEHIVANPADYIPRILMEARKMLTKEMLQLELVK